MSRSISLVFVLFTGCFGELTLPAQAGPLYLSLQGVGVSVTGAIGEGGSDVQVVGNYAYLAWYNDWYNDTATNHPGGLEIFDVAHPTNPVRVGGYDSSAQVNAVRVVGRYAYLAEGVRRTWTNDSGAFEIIDVSDAAHPVRVGGTATRGRATAMHVAGNFAYVPESTRWTGSNLLGALEIFDVSSPTNPLRVATYDTGGSATSVDVSGGYAYLADGVTDLQVLDVSDPTNPVQVGEDRIQGDASIQVVGSRVYLATDNLLIYEFKERPVIKSSRAGGMLVLTWGDATDFILQRTASLADPDWSDVPGSVGQSGIELPMGNGSEFFRLVRP